MRDMARRAVTGSLAALVCSAALALSLAPLPALAEDAASAEVATEAATETQVTETQETTAEQSTTTEAVRLTSFAFAEESYSLRGIDAGQVVIHSTDLEFVANEGAQYDVVSVVCDNADVCEVRASERPNTGEPYWCILPEVMGGTATLTATAVDNLDPTNVLTATVEVTCSQGQYYLPVPDLQLGEDGVLAVPMGWADQGCYRFFGGIQTWMRRSYWEFTVELEDDSLALVDGLTLTPLKTGSTSMKVTATDLFYNKTQTFDLTLVIEDSDAVYTAENEDGATLSHVLDSEGEINTWRYVKLVTDWLGDEENPVPDGVTEAVNAALEDLEKFYVYDIHLVDSEGNVFEIPEGESVTVTLPIPEGMGTAGVRVLHVADDGTVTDMDGVVDAASRTVTFETTHFSTFVIAQVSVEAEVEQQKPAGGQGTVVKPDDESTTPETGSEPQSDASEKTDGLAQTGDASALPALLAATTGAAALLGAVALRRRR